MKKGSFIWTDLSSYNPIESVAFYKSIFDWDVNDLGGYALASKDSQAIAGVFETPEPLKRIKMPHFWMSYFQVDSTPATVERAKKMGARVEVDCTPFYSGEIALIRDPMGAGFTVYDGKKLDFKSNKKHGSIFRTELHVSNVQTVIPFYENLFDWKIVGHGFSRVYQIKNHEIYIKEFANEIKGKFEYWAISFYVNDLASVTDQIIKSGGLLISEEGSRNLMTDNSHEAFFYIQELQ